MKLLLIRHGETAGNRQRYIGWEDIPLNDTGRAQAAALAAALADEPLGRVFASPLVRARDTAAPLAEARGLAVEVREELKEIDYGRLQGRLKEGGGRLRLRKQHLTEALPGGESLLDVWRRLERVSTTLHAALSPAHAVAVVGHYWSNRLLAALLRGVPFEEALADRDYKPPNASALELRFEAGATGLHCADTRWRHRPHAPGEVAE